MGQWLGVLERLEYYMNVRQRSLELIPVPWRTPYSSWHGSLDIIADSNLSHMWRSFVCVCVKTSTASTITKLCVWCEGCERGEGAVSCLAKRLFHFRSFVSISIHPPASLCLIYAVIISQLSLAVGSYNFLINIVHESNITCFLSIVHMQGIHQEMCKTSNQELQF